MKKVKRQERKGERNCEDKERQGESGKRAMMGVDDREREGRRHRARQSSL